MWTALAGKGVKTWEVLTRPLSMKRFGKAGQNLQPRAPQRVPSHLGKYNSREVDRRSSTLGLAAPPPFPPSATQQLAIPSPPPRGLPLSSGPSPPLHPPGSICLHTTLNTLHISAACRFRPGPVRPYIHQASHAFNTSLYVFPHTTPTRPWSTEGHRFPNGRLGSETFESLSQTVFTEHRLRHYPKQLRPATPACPMCSGSTASFPPTCRHNHQSPVQQAAATEKNSTRHHE